MRLLEHQAKAVLARYGIRAPKGVLLKGEADLARAEALGFPLVLKAQLPIGGRGKAGAVVKVGSREGLAGSYADLKGKVIQGLAVDEVLAESFFPHASELYVSYFENRGERCFSLIAAAAGGVEVEDVREKLVLNFGLEGPTASQYGGAAEYLKVPADALTPLLRALYRAFEETEAELVEVNPLAVAGDGSLLALDAKVILDDNSLFRRGELKPYLPHDVSVEEAERYGFNFVPLPGKVAVVGNGAGLVLATLDMVSSLGRSPACFLDLGGGATPDRVLSALKFLSESLPNMEVLFVNVFGGITNSVVVAEGFLEAKKRGYLSRPFFLRLSGAGDAEARELLKESGIDSFIDVEDALQALKRWN